MDVEVREFWSKESLSVHFWREALQRVRECALTENVLFVARDIGSLTGLRRKHGDSAASGFYGIAIEKAHVYYDLGMKFRYAFLIQPTDAVVAGIAPLVTEQLTIARKGETKDEHSEMPRVPDANLLCGRPER